MIKTDIFLGQMKFEYDLVNTFWVPYCPRCLCCSLPVIVLGQCPQSRVWCDNVVLQGEGWGWSAHITILCQVSSSHPPPPPPQQQLGQVEEKKHIILTVKSAAIDFIIPGDVKNNRPNCSHMWTPPTRLIVFIQYFPLIIKSLMNYDRAQNRSRESVITE